MTVPILRPYQEDAIGAVFKRFADGQRRTAVVAATGAGKTVILAELIRRHRESDPRPVLVLAHRAELLNQAANKLRDAMPGTRVGYVAAGRNHVSAPVIVSSVQTLSRANRRARLPDFGLVVVDECHRSVSPSYLKVLADLGCLAPDGPLTAGFTATFTREDSARLTDFWQSVAYSIDILDLIDQDFLVAPRFLRVMVEGLDLSTVATSRAGGTTDLASTELAAAMDAAGAPGVVAAAYRRHAADRQGIVFTPSVASAETVAQALRDVGITSEALAGSTPPGKRADILRRYSSGALQTVVNCAILGEGFDAPATSCVVIARPTLSKILFRQQVGRALRPHPGKTDALILDLVGSTGRNNLATLDDVTNAPVHVEEGETLDHAAKRAATVRAEVTGDAAVSGSLESIMVDPWEAERRAKLTKAERKAEDAGDAPEPEPKAPEERRRYRHVAHRDGWYLQSQGGRWFIPLTSETKRQRGVVAIVPMGAVYQVVATMDGAGIHAAGLFETTADAASRGLELALALLPSGVDRSLSDPDARWRRKKASDGQLRLLSNSGVDPEEVIYSGQVSDYLSLRTHGRIADNIKSV